MQENKHLRYMWIPNTDAVVVVQCNPLLEGQVPEETMSPKYSMDERLSAARSFYKEMASKYLYVDVILAMLFTNNSCVA